MSWLQSHPFAVSAHFEHSLVLTYSFPADELQKLLPAPLQIDRWQDQWGFAAMALVQTRNLRPKGWPTFMGRDFILAGIRLFVRYTDSRGKNLRGLYILRSETNRGFMSFWGNAFTKYKYRTSDLVLTSDTDRLHFQSANSGIDVVAAIGENDVPLPANSCFENWQQARRFAGPLPFTFTWNNERKEMLIIEGVRTNWTPQPVRLIKTDVKLTPALDAMDGILANAFLVSNIPYYWKKGRKEKWNQPQPTI